MSRLVSALNALYRGDGGELVEYFQGDEVTDSEHVAELDRMGALVPEGEEHLDATERMERALGFERVDTTAAESEFVEAVPDVARITEGYKGHSPDLLNGEVEARRAEGREVTVTGSGAAGNVLKDDLIKALEADDEARVS